VTNEERRKWLESLTVFSEVTLCMYNGQPIELCQVTGITDEVLFFSEGRYVMRKTGTSHWGRIRPVEDDDLAMIEFLFECRGFSAGLATLPPITTVRRILAALKEAKGEKSE